MRGVVTIRGFVAVTRVSGLVPGSLPKRVFSKRQQLDRRPKRNYFCPFRQVLYGLYQKSFELRADPEHRVGLLQEPRLRRSERVSVRRLRAGHQKRRHSHPAHHPGDD